MTTLLRVELILPHSSLDKCIKILEKGGAEGYTILDPVQGKGRRGIRDGLGLTDAFTNAMVLWYGASAKLEALRPALQALLLEAGGIATLTEVKQLGDE